MSHLLELTSYSGTGGFIDLCVTKKNLNNQFTEDVVSYHLYGPDANSLTWHICILKGSDDATNFENNYKSKFNYAIRNLVNAYTYTGSATKVSPDSGGPTDMFTLTGSATKVVRVVRVWLTGTQTTASVLDVRLKKRSTANSGGTCETPDPIPHDSLSPVATATVRAYTANPTVGTIVGNLLSRKIMIPASSDKTATPEPLYEADLPSQSIVLRGTDEVLSVHMGGDVITGGKLNCTFEWTEE